MATSHTRLRARDHCTSSTLILDKAQTVQVRFTLRLRDQRSMWMQVGCKVYMDSYMASNGPCFMVTWTTFRNHLLEVGLNTKPGDHWHNRWLVLFYHVWGPTWIEIHRNSIWLRAQSHMISLYTCKSMTALHDFGGVLGRPSDTFFFALSQFHARALGSKASYIWTNQPNVWVVATCRHSSYTLDHLNMSCPSAWARM